MFNSSAVAERPRNALCPSVVSLNKIITRAESFIILYLGFRFTIAQRCLRRNVEASSHTLRRCFSAINKLRRLPATSVINSPWSVDKCIALAVETVHSTQ